MLLNWKNGYEQWELVKFETATDGHCLFHALCAGFFIPYQTGVLNGKPIGKLEIIHHLRLELAEKLGQFVKDNVRYYDLLHNGNLAAFAESVPEYKLECMQQQLNSNCSIGYGFIEFIADQLNKDIYILNGVTQDLYKSDEMKQVVKNRNAVVLYYLNHHYELIGIKSKNGYDTHFLNEHPFIQFLQQKI
jgi:hypothetical protein